MSHLQNIVDIRCGASSSLEIRSALRSALEDRPPIVKLSGAVDIPAPLLTPLHWRDDCLTRHDREFLRLCETIGNVFGYPDLQEGRLVQEILPIAEDAEEQVGSGAVELVLHTEDPSLEERADYLAFLCLSNRDCVPTLVSIPDFNNLTVATLERLARPSFPVIGDRDNGGAVANVLHVSPLSRTDEGRYRLIYDPVYLLYDHLDPQDLEAFSALRALMDDSVSELLLNAGDVAFIDNYRVAHGRPRYSPRYDRTDRWLKRAHISLRSGSKIPSA